LSIKFCNLRLSRVKARFITQYVVTQMIVVVQRYTLYIVLNIIYHLCNNMLYVTNFKLWY